MAKEAQSWSMPQVSIPGMGGASGGILNDFNSFSDRMQRKKERQENQEIQRARQLEVDAVNQERYLTAQSRIDDQLMLQANNLAHERDRQEIQDGYAKTNHANAQTIHGFNVDNQKHNVKMNENKLSTSNMNHQLAERSFGFQNKAGDIHKNVMTEQQQEIENTANFYNEQVAKGLMTPEAAAEYGEKIGNATANGTLDVTQVTDITGYENKMNKPQEKKEIEQ